MEIFAPKHGLLKDLSSDTFASELFYFCDDELKLTSSTHKTYFGYVQHGEINLHHAGNQYTLTEGMYFSVTQSLNISTNTTGKAIIMSRLDYHGFFQIGGPIEEKGRLTYIDGCTDSLLISPVMMGDPCLNLLHIPARIQQSQHTHPSLRLGVIISGTGTCITPEKNLPLTPGSIFYIPQDGKHSFHTQNHDLRVIAYHPDSDYGPTHQNHPMVNKTIL
ncbi:MAG: AraC family ligand binding domain-containing protein [Akkermansiaceae bacterium]